MTSNIAEFYAGSKVFITGSTGFVGIALVEKLLRTIPDIDAIYLLIRPKKEKQVSERLAYLIKNPIFEMLLEARGTVVFNKLIPIAGDIAQEGLGLSVNDRETIVNNVNFVFHSAATLDFKAGLKQDVVVNLLGTRRIVELCKEIRNLRALLHVSTAYANSNRLNAEECIYPAASQNLERAVNIATSTDEATIAELTPTLLGGHPNTYTFTKALAEHEVANSISFFPSCIIRPSMIIGAWKEPVPGWTSGQNGPQCIIMGAAKGVVRRLPMDKHKIYDYIPVDIVINHIIVGAWYAAIKSPAVTPVFHCTSSTYRPFRWGVVKNKVDTLLHKYPLKSAVWYPTLKFLPSLTLFKLSAIIFHFIPAYIFDAVIIVSGGKPVLVKLHKSINRSLNRLAPFITNEFMFSNTKTLELHRSLSEQDQKQFGMDIGLLQWDIYLEDMTQGIRKYLHKELPNTLSSARIKDKVLMVLNFLVQGIAMFLIWTAVSYLLGSSLNDCFIYLPILIVLIGYL